MTSVWFFSLVSQSWGAMSVPTFAGQVEGVIKLETENLGEESRSTRDIPVADETSFLFEISEANVDVDAGKGNEVPMR